MSSSLLPLNITPVMTSIQPRPSPWYSAMSLNLIAALELADGIGRRLEGSAGEGSYPAAGGTGKRAAPLAESASSVYIVYFCLAGTDKKTRMAKLACLIPQGFQIGVLGRYWSGVRGV
jgi:hypothetical protein